MNGQYEHKQNLHSLLLMMMATSGLKFTNKEKGDNIYLHCKEIDGKLNP
jgi:hypothetical protein